MKVLLFPALLTVAILTTPPKGTHWAGSAISGQQENKIDFVVSADGKYVSGLTFGQFWNCSGPQAKCRLAPQELFEIQNGKVSGVVTNPIDSSTAWRFDLQGDFTGKTAAKGTFRMNINALGSDTYKLQWTAAPTR
jgi:hypothetical protein